MMRLSPHLIRPAQSAHREGCMSALGRLAQLLAPEDNGSNAERIPLLRQVYFADVDALQKSGTVKLPE